MVYVVKSLLSDPNRKVMICSIFDLGSDFPPSLPDFVTHASNDKFKLVEALFLQKIQVDKLSADTQMTKTIGNCEKEVISRLANLF